jgi:epoxide hydrolase-like predicted phosphatase
MTIQAIIFDFGGVLVRTSDFTPRERLAARFGMTSHELMDLVFVGDSGMGAQRGEITIEQHWENVRLALKLTPQELVDFKDEFWSKDVIDTELIEYIRSLHRSYRTALLSNAFSDLRQMIIEQWRFADAFDTLVISSEIGIVKPDPRIYHLVLERLGVQPAEAVFVDDFQKNIEGAKAVGMQGIHFRDPEQARSELEQLLKAK